MMIKRVKNKLFRLGTGITVALLAAGSAEASYLVTGAGIDSKVGSLAGTVNYTPKPLSENAQIGRILLTGTDSVTKAAFSWASYCVDIFDTLKTGTFASAPVSALNLSTGKLSQLNALLSNVDPYVTTATTSAAAQMAVWEIVNEASGSYDVTNGAFNVTNISADSADDANKMLLAVTSGYWKASDSFSMALLTGSGNQAQLVYGANAKALTAAVPEPASWAMMVGGFGMLGATMRRRRSVSATSHAIA